jgi:uncharacterized protein YgiB involved in biofilm formation
MKRSKVLKLAVLGAAPMLLVGCEEEQRPALVYESMQACISAAQLPEQTCRVDYAAAEAAHVATAPRYLSSADCQADFGSGQCQQNVQSGGYFMPFMTGYMIASMMQGGAGNWQNTPGGHSAQPLYRTSGSNTWRTADNTQIGSRSGAISVPKSSAQPPTRAVTMSRSGFGSSASARGTWGG